jgi:hypothetical protein
MKFGPVFRPLVPGLGTLMLNLQALVSFIPLVLSSLSGLATPILESLAPVPAARQQRLRICSRVP